MTERASLDVWRARVVEQIESGMNRKDWAALHGVPYEQLGVRARLLFEREPELFARTGRFCPCPLMARIIRYRNPEVREYLKHVWFEAGKAMVGDRGYDWQIGLLGSVRVHLKPDSTSADIGLGLLRAIKASTSRATAIKVAVLAAVASGVHDGDPFFDWAAGSEGLIRACDTAGHVMLDLIEDGGYRRARLVRCHSGREGGFTAATLFTFDTSDEFCTGLLDGFIAQREGGLYAGDRLFFAHFAESLGFIPESLDDFTPETFGRQLEWFSDNVPRNSAKCPLRLTRLFYAYVIDLLPGDQQAFTFATGLPPKALGYTFIVQMWLRGYRAVVYEPLDPAPGFPKWLLYPNAAEAAKASFSIDVPKAVSCAVGDPALERLLVSWIWEGGLGATTVRIAPSQARVLLGKVAEEGLSVVREGAARPVVSARSVAAALAELAVTNGHKKLCGIKGRLGSFLRFAEGRGGLVVEPACYLLLENVSGSSAWDSGESADAVPAEDLAALAGELERTAERSVVDELTYIAFIVQALTPLRFSEILSLRVRDLDASRRKGFDAVRVCRKSGGYDYELVEVPRDVHRLLKTAVAITEPVRARADEAIAEHVFLMDGLMGAERILPKATCDRRLADACRRLGIAPITPGDVRRAYETTVIMEGAKRNWNRMMLRPITGHADVRSDEAYITPDIMNPETRRYLEGAYVVEIGSPRIRGEVLPDEEVPDDLAVLVEAGAGVCRNADCDVLGTMPCFECESFATAPRLIPEMVELIAAVDKQLASAPLHQREHLMVAKRRALAYLGMMVDMEKRKEASDGGAGSA